MFVTEIFVCRCLNPNADNNAVSSFLMSDLAQNMSVNVSKAGLTNLAVITQSGILHFFSHHLNGYVWFSVINSNLFSTLMINSNFKVLVYDKMKISFICCVVNIVS